MPPGGDGVYYFSLYVLVQTGEFAGIDMTLNDDIICSIEPDHSAAGSDYAQGSCSAIINVAAGDIYLFTFNKI